MKAKIGVKYCGNCNPHLDGPEFVKELQRLNPDLLFVSYNAEDKDLLLIVSSCQADCATRPDYQGNTVVVSGYTLDFTPVKPDQLPAAVSKKLREMLDLE
ncbi:MAG: hypothetical protein WBL58_08825 [Peptococcia bacterium]